MRTFRLIGMTLLMIMLTVNFTACSDDDDNELSLPVDNTLELLIGTWEGTGEVEGEILTFNKDNTLIRSRVKIILKVVRLNTSLTDICLLLTIQQLIGEKRIPFTQSLR